MRGDIRSRRVERKRQSQIDSRFPQPDAAGNIDINILIGKAQTYPFFQYGGDAADPCGIYLIGELSLAGEIRPLRRLKPLIKTAQSLGFTQLYVPAAAGDGDEPEPAMQGITRVENLAETIKYAFGTGK